MTRVLDSQGVRFYQLFLKIKFWAAFCMLISIVQDTHYFRLEALISLFFEERIPHAQPGLNRLGHCLYVLIRLNENECDQ